LPSLWRLENLNSKKTDSFSLRSVSFPTPLFSKVPHFSHTL
jgi:hypothetical protein